MELNVYDTELIPLGVLEEIRSLIWIRRYWSCGEFKLLVPFTPRHAAILTKNRVILKRGGAEAAQIRYVDIKKNSQGVEEIEAQGKMLPWWLDKRIVRNPIITTANTQDILTRIVAENVTAPADTDRTIPALTIAVMEDLGSGSIEYASEPFISALLACEDAAKAAKLGFKITTDVRTQSHAFIVYKGRELTTDQTDNPPCIFAQEFDNILEQEYTNSIENLKSVAFVGGEEKEGATRQIVQVGTAAGLERDEVFINATDITQTYKNAAGVDVTMTLAQYLNMLTQRGASELEQYAETLNFSSKINPYTNLKYGEDFDLGDRVTCINKRWGIKINVRITEIEETYQEGKTDIDITFGESLPTILDQLRKMG
jgi:hypothetical protein